MKNEALKGDARRLRTAITEMFGIPVSVSQSYELVARERNYPNWDAASACAVSDAKLAPAEKCHVAIALRTVGGTVTGFATAERTACDRGDLAATVNATLKQHGFGYEVLVCQVAPDGATATLAPEWDESEHGFETHPFSVSIRASGWTMTLADVRQALVAGGVRLSANKALPEVTRMLHGGPGLYLLVGAHNTGRTTLLNALKNAFMSAARPNLSVVPIFDAQRASADPVAFAQSVEAIRRADPDVVLIDELANPTLMQTAVSLTNGGVQVFACLTCSALSVAAVMEAVNAMDPTGVAVELVRGIVRMRRDGDGSLQVQMGLRDEGPTTPGLPGGSGTQ